MERQSVKQSKEELRKIEITTLKNKVEQESWIALKQYFDGRGNGPEAKIAVITLGILAKEAQAKNNSRQLDIIEQRLLTK